MEIFWGLLALIFLIWLFWFEFHDKEKHLKAKEEMNVHFQKSTIGNSTTEVHCPKCGSTQIQLMKRGWKVTTGFLGSSKNERVCMNCKHKF